MDGTRFDRWVKELAAAESRRTVIRTLVGVSLGALSAIASRGEVAADCQQVGQKCEKDGECCAGAHCKRGECRCVRGAATCGTACCGRNEECVGGNGESPAVCCREAKVCGSRCCPPDRICLCFKPIPGLDPPPDPDDLCRCVCPEGYEENADGKCECQQPCGDGCCSADDGEVCCRDANGDTHCVRITLSRQHCGECGKTCPHDRICVAGTCVCPQDAPECGGTCCPPGARCLNRKCVVWEGPCAPGDDACITGRSKCGGEGCNCRTTMERETRCGMNPEGFDCASTDYQCGDDAACAWLGPGAFCAKNTGEYCDPLQVCGFPLPEVIGHCKVPCAQVSCGQLGEHCVRNSECCGHQDGVMTCDENGCGDVVCCLQESEPCGVDSCECCGSLQCIDGNCAKPRGCKDNGESCAEGDLCCSGPCLRGKCVPILR